MLQMIELNGLLCFLDVNLKYCKFLIFIVLLENIRPFFSKFCVSRKRNKTELFVSPFSYNCGPISYLLRSKQRFYSVNSLQQDYRLLSKIMSHSSFLVALTIYVLPTFGVILGSCMFFAPVPALLSALRRGSLGDLNPLPWAFMLGNTLGWTTYSFLTKGTQYTVFYSTFKKFFLIIPLVLTLGRLFRIHRKRPTIFAGDLHEYGSCPIAVP